MAKGLKRGLLLFYILLAFAGYGAFYMADSLYAYHECHEWEEEVRAELELSDPPHVVDDYMNAVFIPSCRYSPYSREIVKSVYGPDKENE